MTKPPRAHVCLITGGGYPFRRDALAGWCHALVSGLNARHHGPRVESLVSIQNTELHHTGTPDPAYRLPAHVRSTHAIALDGIPTREPTEHEIAAARLLAVGLSARDDASFTTGAATLAGLTDGDRTPRLPLADLLREAWQEHNATGLEPHQARIAADLIERVVRALGVPLPEADLLHCVTGTTQLLAALGARWRTGTPLLLTDARPAAERPEIHDDGVRRILRRFRRAVARTAHAEAALVAPVSDHQHALALHHGAAPERIVPVPPGVDPADFPAAPEPPGRPPTLVWVGDGGPASGIDRLLDAYTSMVSVVTDLELHLVGVVPRHRRRVGPLVAGRPGRIVERPARQPRDRYRDAHLVIHLPSPADPPHRLAEAMMSGRAVVAAEAGGVSETLGDAGVVVPDRDPMTLAGACLSLLQAPARRRALGEAARRRALARFTADRVVRAYAGIYADLTAPPPAPAYELPLAIPAPRPGVTVTGAGTLARVPETPRRKP